MLLILTGFQYISGGSVTTIQRMDIPLLILYSAITSHVRKTQLFLAVLTFVIILTLVIVHKRTNERPIGYALVLLSVICICMNALLQKNISTKERVEIIIINASLSSLLWSLTWCLYRNAWFENVGTIQCLILAMFGFFEIIIVCILVQLYKIYSPDFVRYPFLLSAIFTMIAEMVIVHKHFSPIVIVGNSLLVVIVTYLIKTRIDNRLTTQAQASKERATHN